MTEHPKDHFPIYNEITNGVAIGECLRCTILIQEKELEIWRNKYPIKYELYIRPALQRK